MWGEPVPISRVVSLLYAEARELAVEVLGQPISRAVLTVPLTWEEPAFTALRRAAELAGLEVTSIVDEPTAAAWAHRALPGLEGRVGVFDMGAREARFAVLDISRGDYQVLGAVGDDRLGGADLDRVLAETVAEQFLRSAKVDLRASAREWRRLLDGCERAKRQLLFEDPAVLSVKEVLRTDKGVSDLYLPIDRATFALLVHPLVERAIALCHEALGLIGLSPEGLSAVILAGGSTHLPPLWQGLQASLNVPVVSIVPPEFAVAVGAGLHAAERQLRASPR
jgi:molecular chaperone DnaK